MIPKATAIKHHVVPKMSTSFVPLVRKEYKMAILKVNDKIE